MTLGDHIGTSLGEAEVRKIKFKFIYQDKLRSTSGETAKELSSHALGTFSLSSDSSRGISFPVDNDEEDQVFDLEACSVEENKDKDNDGKNNVFELETCPVGENQDKDDDGRIVSIVPLPAAAPMK